MKQKIFLYDFFFLLSRLEKMAFFRNLHQNLSLPSVSSLVDTLSSAVDDLTSVVGEVGYSVADSVTEQVTNMINGLRAEDESSKMQNDKTAQDRDENAPWLTEPKEINMKAKRDIAEQKEVQYSGSLEDTNQDGVSNHVVDENQYQLKGKDSNDCLEDTEVPWDFKNVGRPLKREAVGENDCFGNKLLKDTNLKSNKFTMQESIEKQDSCLHTIPDNSKNHLHKKIKPRSPGIDCNDSEEVHGMNISRDLETKFVKVQKQKLSDSSLKMHSNHPSCINEIKEKSEASFDRKEKSEGDASPTVAKVGNKKNSKKSEKKSRGLCNKKTAGKGEKSVRKLHSSAFPETYGTSYFFHLSYTFHLNNDVSRG